MSFEQAEKRRDVARNTIVRAWEARAKTEPNMGRRWIDIDNIYIGDRLRAPDMARVSEIAKSISEIGLLNPPAVRIVDKMVIEGVEEGGVPVLIVGHHRVLALKSLGKETIECDVYKVDPLRAELMEIAENLHRAELTVLERAKQVARWIELTEYNRASDEQDKPAQVAPVSKGGRGKESGVNAAARELGIERTAAQRDVKIASLSPEAEAAAVAAGLDDNQSALLEAAKESEPEKQVAVIEQRKAAKPTSRPDEARRNTREAHWQRAVVGAACDLSVLFDEWQFKYDDDWKRFPVTPEMLEHASNAVAAWSRLEADLRRRLAGGDQQRAA